ncbi:TPA: DUF4355 domain-containing protein [Staphylococcus aureus]|uniref:DUF4355 domain-containing protein n=1 Tax=Staphylococcus aureus TaxID=1280 RepID=UPI0020261585|nr:DUF4355 domain-containing protein [Staphylococcus aureus]MCL9714843.1 DUF4355 domain-containing protein [Staphylococcus aureus]MCL9720316.1 DUF4355 domain-containing protein [Staphylococcus aureus]WJD10972.1 DUF4355 domain-containing protein [Staphylococcus aureus]HCY0946478.1 DUF4355 domain-containing protein [Staphylococcus aureus]HEG7160631.1 DUF4355 domain-containing protein [Staphylococcus aureus]
MEENKLKFNLQFFADQSDDPDEPGGDGKKGNPDKKENDEGTEITFTPEQQKKVDEILERRVAHEKKKADEYAKEKAAEAAKLAKMNKDQKDEYEREQMEKELEQLRSEKQLNEMRSEARKMLSEAEVDSSDEVVNLVVTDTAEQTKLNVEAFSNAVKKAVNEAVKVNARQSPLTGGDSFNHSTKNKPQNLAEIARQKRIIKN